MGWRLVGKSSVDAIRHIVLVLALATPSMAPSPRPTAEFPSPFLTSTAEECLVGVPAVAEGSKVTQDFAGDFDGDGHPDRVQLIDLPMESGKPPRRRTAIRIVFARGVSTPLQELFEGDEIIGVADLDGDQRDEVLLRLDGNTVWSGGIFVAKNCRLQPVVQQDGSLYGFYYYGRSNFDLRSGMGFTCPLRAGKGRDLVEVRYEPELGNVDRTDFEAFFKALERPDLPFRWQRRTLRLTGTRVRVMAQDSGRSIGEDKKVPMINRFACGGVDPE
jgi:hypothetical protein